ncbi:hypothetical protein QNI19_30770 [Cytophagaceae bacterium DM2B3-1]|uniref:DUF4468 domain-containing protein n=1 Tax=Xanthocytophaga flava TaxID=3048013 RepID=A0ABT7CWN0_9BACT|nr:hypothetical protein [Xanthocytophaga flavus]MDJ1497362.1 hypothetical protein [Xanthocytophaga flavus]
MPLQLSNLRLGMNDQYKSNKFLLWIIGCIMLVFVNISVKAQTLASLRKQESNQILKQIKAFLVSKNLQKGDSLPQQADILEIRNQTLLQNQSVGVYQFGVSANKSKQYILLRDHAHCTIVDPDQLGNTVKMTTDFLRERHFTPAQIEEYSQEIQRIYEYNQNFSK